MRKKPSKDAKQKLKQDLGFAQPDINIGMVGHIDHGKTTLLYKLSKKWADTHSEELRRGITIRLGYANVEIMHCKSCDYYFTLSNKCPKCNSEAEMARHVSFVDAPGHEMLMASMLGGAAIIDAALLIVATNEPFPQPQTKEHFLALSAKGVKHLIVVQNKIDLVDKERVIQNYLRIREFLKNTPYENAPIIPISALQGVNLHYLLKAITELPKPERDLNANPVFFVVRSFDVNKPGTRLEHLNGAVLGGALKQGVLRVGDIIEIKPGLTIKHGKKHQQIIEYKTLKAKVIGLMSGNNKLEEALPYGSLAIQTSLDPSLGKSDNLAGCVVGLADSLPEITSTIKIKARLFKKVVGAKQETKVEALKINEPLLLSVNTATTVGFVKNVKQISEHESLAELQLKIPIVPIKDTRIGIARNLQGHWRLIGYAELV